MDIHLRELERRAQSGDLEAAELYLQICYRQWDGERDSSSFRRLQNALHLLGSMTIELFVDDLNDELEKTGIPFNPLGIAATKHKLSGASCDYWWASLKERYSLEPEMTMHGHMACEPEEYGQIPGFQQHYGIGGYYYLYPDGHKTFDLWDTTTGAKVDEWLGHGDAEEVYRLSQIHGYYGGDYPQSWVSHDEYLRREGILRQEIVDAVYRADPEITVIRKVGMETTILPPSRRY